MVLLAKSNPERRGRGRGGIGISSRTGSEKGKRNGKSET